MVKLVSFLFFALIAESAIACPGGFKWAVKSYGGGGSEMSKVVPSYFLPGERVKPHRDSVFSSWEAECKTSPVSITKKKLQVVVLECSKKFPDRPMAATYDPLADSYEQVSLRINGSSMNSKKFYDITVGCFSIDELKRHRAKSIVSLE